MLLHKLLLAAIICLAVWHTFSLLRRRKELGVWKLMASILLKYGWISILLIILFMPLRSRSEEEKASPLTLILDGTQSYRLPGTETRSRYARAIDLLKKGLWDDLSDRFHISAYQLTANGLDPFDSPGDLTVPEDAALTPLNSAMESLVQRDAKIPVLLFSDGLDTTKGIPPETVSFPEGTAPVYGVRFPYSPRERALFSAVRHDQAVWRGAPWKLEAELTGSWERPVTVELLLDGEVIDSQSVTPLEEKKEKGGRSTLSFEHCFKKLGTKKISLRITADPDILTSRPYETEIDILPIPARKVWFITCNPGTDAVFWRRSLRSLTSVELTSTTIYNLKAKEDELWAYQETERGREYLRIEDMPDFDQFDLVMLHGPFDPSVQPFWRMLNKFNFAGGGCVNITGLTPWWTYTGYGETEELEGNNYTKKGDYIFEMEEDLSIGNKPFNLVDLLPNEIVEGASKDLESNPSGFLPINLYKPEALEVILEHPTLKSAYGVYPLFMRKAKGKGFETDWCPLDTWRMAIQPGGADIHRKLVQWIMDQTAPQYSSPIDVRPADRWLAVENQYDLELIPYRDKANFKEIRPQIDGPEPRVIRADISDCETKIEWVPGAPGNYTMRILDKDGEKIQTETWQAGEHWLEWACPEMDEDKFASALEGTGGRLIEGSSFSVDDILPPPHKLKEIPLAEMEPLWDKWWLFTLLAALMLGEWATRRAAGLA